MTNDLNILLTARLDKSNKSIELLKNDIIEISKKLEGINLKLNIGQNIQKDLKNASLQIQNIADSLNKLSITGKNISKQSLVKVNGQDVKLITDINHGLGQMQKIVQELSGKKNVITTTTIDNNAIKKSKDELEAFRIKYLSLLQLMQQGKSGGFVDKENLNIIKQLINETNVLDKISKQYIQNEVNALKQKAQMNHQLYQDRKKYEESISKLVLSNEEKIRKALNQRMQGALGLGTKFTNLSPEQTQSLDRLLNRYKQIIKEFQQKNISGMLVSDKDLTKLKNLENAIERIYQKTRIASKDQQGFNFQQFPKMENAIRNATNAQEYYNNSILKGHHLLQTTINQTEQYIKVTQRLRQGSEIKTITAYINKATGETHKFSESVKDLMIRTFDLGSAFKNAFQKIGLWAGATSIFYGIANAAQNIWREIVEIDLKMTELSKVMSEATNWGQLFNELAQSANYYAQTISAALDATVNFAKQGYEAEDAIKLANAAMLGANVTMIETAELSSYLTGILSQFNLTADEATQVINKLNEVDNNFAVTSTSLAMSLNKAGEAAQQYGLSIDELIGYTTAIITSTRESGNVVGNMLKTVFSRINMSEVQSKFEELGIATKNLSGDIRPLNELYGELANKWKLMTREQKLSTSVTMAGRWHVTRFMALMDNYGISLNAATTAQHSLNSALEENYRHQRSLTSQINRMKASWQEFAVAIGESGVADTMTVILRLLSQYTQGLTEITTSHGTAATSVGVLTIALVALLPIYKENLVLQKALSVGLIQQNTILGTLKISWASLTATVRTATGVLTAFSRALLLNPMTWVVAVATAVPLILGHMKQVREEQKMLNDSYQESIEKLNEIKKITKEIGTPTLQVVSDIEKQIQLIDEYIQKIKDLKKEQEKNTITTYNSETGFETYTPPLNLTKEDKDYLTKLGVNVNEIKKANEIIKELTKIQYDLNNALKEGKQNSTEYQQQLIKESQTQLKYEESIKKLIDEYIQLKNAGELNEQQNKRLSEVYFLLSQEFPEYVENNELVIELIQKEAEERYKLAEGNVESTKTQLLENRKQLANQRSKTIGMISEYKKEIEILKLLIEEREKSNRPATPADFRISDKLTELEYNLEGANEESQRLANLLNEIDEVLNSDSNLELVDEESTKQLETYTLAIEELNLAIQELQNNRKKLINGSEEYKKSIQREIELKQKQIDLIKEQIKQNRNLASSTPAILSYTSSQSNLESQIKANLPSHLKDYSSNFVSTGQKYGVNPALLSAIAIAEGVNPKYNNPGGMFINNKLHTFNTMEQGIEAIGRTISSYFKEGITTLEGIQKKYAPVGAGNDPNGLNDNWLNNVKTALFKIQGNTADTVNNIKHIDIDPKKYLTGDVDFNTELQKRLALLAKDKGLTINVTSGYRSIEEQQAIWDRTPIANRGKTVAAPGKSKHQSGLAVDVADEWVKKLTNEELAKYGLVKPMDYESWHIELAKGVELTETALDQKQKDIDLTKQLSQEESALYDLKLLLHEANIYTYTNENESIQNRIQWLQALRENQDITSEGYRYNLNRETELIDEQTKHIQSQIKYWNKVANDPISTRFEIELAKDSVEQLNVELANLQNQKIQLEVEIDNSQLEVNNKVADDYNEILEITKLNMENLDKTSKEYTNGLNIQKQAYIGMLSAKQKNIALIQEDINSGKYQGKALENLKEQSEDAIKEAFGLSNAIQAINKEQQEIEKQKSFEKLKKQIEDALSALEPFNNELDLLKTKFDLISESDLENKMEIIADQFKATKKTGQELRDAFSDIASITPKNKEEADELISTLTSLKDQIKDNILATIQYQKELDKLRVQSIVAPFERANEALERELNLISHNLSMLEGGLPTGMDIMFGSDFILPEIPQSLYDQQRNELERMLESQEDYEREIQELKDKSFEEQKAEQDEFYQEMMKTLIQHYAEMLKTILGEMGLEEKEQKEHTNEIDNIVKNGLSNVESNYDTAYLNIITKLGGYLTKIKQMNQDVIDDIGNVQTPTGGTGDSGNSGGSGSTTPSTPPSSSAPSEWKVFEGTEHIYKVDPNGNIYKDNRYLALTAEQIRALQQDPAGVNALAYAKQIKGYAKGTSDHPGGLSVVGEKGEELTLLPSGKAVILGKNGAELVNLPKGSKVIPNKETEEILNTTKTFPRYENGIGLDTSTDNLKKIINIIVATVNDIKKLEELKSENPDKLDIYSSAQKQLMLQGFGDYKNLPIIFNKLIPDIVEQIFGEDYDKYRMHSPNSTKGYKEDVLVREIEKILSSGNYSTSLESLGWNETLIEKELAKPLVNDIKNIYESLEKSIDFFGKEIDNNEVKSNDIYDFFDDFNTKIENSNKIIEELNDLGYSGTLPNFENLIDEVSGFSKNFSYDKDYESVKAFDSSIRNIPELSTLPVNNSELTLPEIDLENTTIGSNSSSGSSDSTDWILGENAQSVEEYRQNREATMSAIEADQQEIINYYKAVADGNTELQNEIINSLPEGMDIEGFKQDVLNRIDQQLEKDVKFQYNQQTIALNKQLEDAQDLLHTAQLEYNKALDEGNITAVEEWVQKYQDAFATVQSIQQQIKENIKNRYDYEFGLIDKKIQKESEEQDNLNYELEMTNAVDPENFEKISQINQSILDSQKNQKQILLDNKNTLLEQQKTLEVGSYEWNLVNDKIKEYNEQLEDSNLSIAQQINNIRSIAIDNIEKIRDARQKQHDEEIEFIEEERDAYNKFIDDKLKLLDRQYESEDYQKRLSKAQEERQEIQNKINELALDNSLEAQAKKKELEKELAEKNEEIQEMQIDRNRELRKEALNDQKDAHNEEVDEKLNNLNDMHDLENKKWDGLIESVQNGTISYNELMNSWFGSTIESLIEFDANVNTWVDNIKTSFESLSDIKINYPEVPENPEVPIMKPNTIYGNSIDIGMAKKIFGNSYNYINTENIDPNSINFKSGDIIAGGTKAIGGIGENIDIKDAIRLGGESRADTQQLLRQYFDNLPSFDSGGILSILHEKELVLNQEQTKAMLKLKDYLPEFVKQINPSMFIPNITNMVKNIIPQQPVLSTGTNNVYNLNLNIESLNGTKKDANMVFSTIVNGLKTRGIK